MPMDESENLGFVNGRVQKSVKVLVQKLTMLAA